MEELKGLFRLYQHPMLLHFLVNIGDVNVADGIDHSKQMVLVK